MEVFSDCTINLHIAPYYYFFHSLQVTQIVPTRICGRISSNYKINLCMLRVHPQMRASTMIRLYSLISALRIVAILCDLCTFSNTNRNDAFMKAKFIPT